MTPITDPNDPRITHEDRRAAVQLSDFLITGMHHATDECRASLAAIIAQNRISQVCRALNLREEDYPRLSSLIWYHTDGQNHGWHAETWKEHAEELTKERDKLRDQREMALCALGMHPDCDSVDIAAEITRIRDEGRAHFHTLTLLQYDRDTFKQQVFDLQLSLRAYETLDAARHSPGVEGPLT